MSTTFQVSLIAIREACEVFEDKCMVEKQNCVMASLLDVYDVHPLKRRWWWWDEKDVWPDNVYTSPVDGRRYWTHDALVARIRITIKGGRYLLPWDALPHVDQLNRSDQLLAGCDVAKYPFASLSPEDAEFVRDNQRD